MDEIQNTKTKKSKRNRLDDIIVADIHSLEVINKARKDCGMELITVGKIKCLCCEKLFLSKNVKVNRMCYDCKRRGIAT